jgi:hypothetical protein
MMTNAYRIIMENLMGGCHLEDLGVDDLIMLNNITQSNKAQIIKGIGLLYSVMNLELPYSERFLDSLNDY